jgi:hypothetical protein
MIAAIGVAHDGKKTVLGLREGATENAVVVRELLEDLARRGLDFSTPRLYVLDGAKALSTAVKRHAGEAALIQRCQVHKRRNVLDQLPEEYQPGIERKMIAAYAMAREADARRALDQIHRELERINPSAARSRGHGRNAHGSQTADAGDAAEIAGFDQHHRTCLLSCRGTLPSCEALAGRRSSGALGGIGTLTGGKQVPPRQGLQGDSTTVECPRQPWDEERGCLRGQNCVT